MAGPEPLGANDPGWNEAHLAALQPLYSQQAQIQSQMDAINAGTDFSDAAYTRYQQLEMQSKIVDTNIKTMQPPAITGGGFEAGDVQGYAIDEVGGLDKWNSLSVTEQSRLIDAASIDYQQMRAADTASKSVGGGPFGELMAALATDPTGMMGGGKGGKKGQRKRPHCKSCEEAERKKQEDAKKKAEDDAKKAAADAKKADPLATPADKAAANRAALDKQFAEGNGNRILRVDDRGEQTIFGDGFSSKGGNKDFNAHVYENPKDGMFVSTSTSTSIIDDRQLSGVGKKVYEIDGGYNLIGVDANKNLTQNGMNNPFAHEREFAVAGSVPKEAIVNVRTVLPNGGLSDAIPNPSYVPSGK